MQEFFRSRRSSFRYAFEGIAFVVRTQKNAWIHLLVALLVILLSILLKLPARDWAVLVLVIGLVIAAEFFNTAVEAMVDLLSPEIHPQAKIAKDVAAGGVLVTAIISVIVGLLILGRPLLLLLTGAQASP